MKHAEARSRAKRTLVQGLLVTVIIAVAGVTLQVIGSWSHDDMVNATAWTMYATSVAQAILTSVASWAQRVFEDRAHE